jgi:luciferase family oxidoreductase group 1
MLALRRMAGNDDLLVLLHELHGFFTGFSPGEAYEGIRAFPGYGGSMPAVWLLGSSGYSAQAAGMMGLPFAFAHHFSAQNTLPALELYRSRFEPSPELDRPYAQVTVFCVCADTDEEAILLASAMALSFASRSTGRPPGPLPSLRQVRNHVWTDAERSFADGYLRAQVIGSPATVKARLQELLAETQADEVMAIASVPDAAARARSFTLLAELAQLPAE